MVAGFEPRLLFLFVAMTASAALLTAMAIRYAHRRHLFDLPGQRRSHDAPTPRGGGIAIVVVMLAGVSVLAMWHGEAGTLLPWLAPPTAAVALAGWLDDVMAAVILVEWLIRTYFLNRRARGATTA
jgi:UDP-N-acetylmuramyl pentapeptide phosphotransferase/UDP-N-acetylglucosamine-1-phosphate transferase